MIKFSVITVAKNAGGSVKKSIESIKNQMYPNYEWIFIDGNSADNTLDIVHKSKLVPDILLSMEPTGVYDALNKGIELASGDYIVFLHADDFWKHENYLCNYAESITNSKYKVQFLYSNAYFVNEHQKVVRKWMGNDFSRYGLVFGWMPPHATICVNTQFVLQNSLWFDNSHKIAADYGWCLDCFKNLKSGEIKYVSKNLLIMRSGGESNGSFKKYVSSLKEDLIITRRHFGKLNIFTSVVKRLRKIMQFLDRG
ncbi:glycosyltransferase [Amylibacter sp.]|nr:glycosyltransferase [Amylibacter sp.]MDC1414103.1 glycosyltransferase [Amylibacter sp.]